MAHRLGSGRQKVVDVDSKVSIGRKFRTSKIFQTENAWVQRQLLEKEGGPLPVDPDFGQDILDLPPPPAGAIHQSKDSLFDFPKGPLLHSSHTRSRLLEVEKFLQRRPI